MKETLTLSFRLGLICAVAALALANVDTVTREPIARAEARAQRAAVEAVLPAFVELAADTVTAADGVRRIYFSGRDAHGPCGTAFVAASRLGYSGLVEIMLGVDPGGTVTGVRVLRHAETPGLGANYAAPELLDRFYQGRAIDADWQVVKDGGSVDAVTGATVTGRALCDAIAGGLAAYRRDRAAAAAPAAPATQEATP